MAAKKMAKKKKNHFIQAAKERMVEKGTVGSYGHHTEKQMEKDKAKGGAIGKKANFALNMEKIRNKKKRKAK
ncbi:MAG: hypothetical protein ACREQ5_32965 [Candidatus Dormibacteria bacterium]